VNKVKNGEEEMTMANFKMSGNVLQEYNGGRSLLKVEGNIIREYNGGGYLLKVEGNIIREYNGGSYLLKVEGNTIREYNGGRNIATVDDVKKMIQGATGTMTDVALWWAITHKR
jgi:hypothetical protein